MPMSDPGHGRHHRQQGFSLLEMLIVLTIIGIATGLAGISAFRDSDARALRQDAERLAQLFSLAQAEARKTGSPVLWRYDDKGYGFEGVERHRLLPLAVLAHARQAKAQSMQPSSLRARQWTSSHEVEVLVEPPSSNLFNTEWISGPLAVELRDGVNSVIIRRSGDGHFEVRP